ncbi:hypothetical protein PTE30175_04447 [Pandoraea terrae]|uniref:Uncharacterized protein n=1 Tax=Pandoraea terrae TaxID=1537710 RepID=A0A5E4YJD9_9BURK|nr:hypothetical protein PTE30175_04447 [Pandoraea terrae]
MTIDAGLLAYYGLMARNVCATWRAKRGGRAHFSHLSTMA